MQCNTIIVNMKIYFALNTIFLCIFLAQTFKQHNYRVIHHHIEVTYQNESFLEGVIKNVRPNRTYRAFDIDFLIKHELSGDQLKVNTHCYYFLNKEYKSSPIQFDVKMCDAMDKNLFGCRDAVMRFGNVTAKCPIKPFKQHDFTLIHHHIELTYMNKLLAEGSIKNVKPNRTYRAFDIEFVLKRDLYGDTFKLKTHCFYFLNNEYKSSPIQFDVKICDVMDKNVFGARDIAMKYGNLTAKCPLKTGHYMMHNFNVPDESLPPNLPEGEYMVVFTVFWDDNKICEIKWFGGIKYKVKTRQRF